MLDAHGWPWKVKWVYTMTPTAAERAASVAHAAAAQVAATAAAAAAPAAGPSALARAGGAGGIALDLSENQIVQVLLALAVGFLIGAHRSS